MTATSSSGSTELPFHLVSSSTRREEAGEVRLEALAAKASTLFERLEAGCSGQARLDEEQVDALLEAWCQAAAGGDPVRFGERLALDGLDVSEVRSAVGAVRGSFPSQNLPRWVHTVAETLDVPAADPSPAWARHYLDPGDPVPFERILAPFVDTAVRRIETGPDEIRGLLSERAHAALERSLLRQLSQLCSPTLALKFSVFRGCRQVTGAIPFVDSLERPGTTQYSVFAREMLEGELWATFQEFPVLARLAATAVDLWVEATAEFLRRLRADRQAIQETFGRRVEMGTWADAEASSSDRHNRGRTVIILTAASGVKLVYKPKNLGTESAYSSLVSWLNGRGSPLPLKTPAVLDRGTHGWVEFVDHSACLNDDEATRFYRRAGMLLCLLHALEATDCHRENLIACGDQPIIVDLETLMHPRERPAGGERGSTEGGGTANELIWRSVLRVGLLPRWDVGKAREAFDLSGLGGYGEQETQYLRWRHVNTDRMELAHELAAMAPIGNVPILEGEPLLPHVFRAEITEGFRSMYRFLLSQREQLLAPGGPLEALVGQPVRFVLRDTMVYGSLQDRLLHPRFLEDGAVRSVELDALARAYLGVVDNRFWPVLRAEREAMERLDVPYFTARSDCDSLSLAPDSVIEHCFEQPSYAHVIARMRAMNEADLDRQISFIQGALSSRAKGVTRSVQVSNEAEPALDAIVPMEPQALLGRAVEIAEDLRDRAIRSADGEATWIAPIYLVEAERFQLQALGFDLYSGSTGVGLFLSALESVTGGAGFRDLALGSLVPLRGALHAKGETRRRFARDVGIGGACGIGSIVYPLVRAAEFLGDAALLEDACCAASLITPEDIDSDQVLDVFSGSAGAILGLLSLHDMSRDPWALEAATLCGTHLVKKRISWDGGPRAWATLDGRSLGRPLAGYSHGAAGIVYALLRLYRTTGVTAFLAAAEEGMAYERRVFVPEAGNWPDFRAGGGDPAAVRFFTTWCHGAPGIGLARLGGLAALDTPQVRREIDIALKTTLEYGLRPLEDHLCCGHFGRMDLLVTASELLGRPELLETARSQATWVVQRAAQYGDFQLHDTLPHGVHNPGFFTGSAGIGYQLLRLAHPDQVPSALLWA